MFYFYMLICYTIGSFISYIMASKEKKIAGVIGIITGILMVLGTIYSSLLVLTVGIIMIVFSKSYLECFK